MNKHTIYTSASLRVGFPVLANGNIYIFSLKSLSSTGIRSQRQQELERAEEVTTAYRNIAPSTAADGGV